MEQPNLDAPMRRPRRAKLTESNNKLRDDHVTKTSSKSIYYNMKLAELPDAHSLWTASRSRPCFPDHPHPCGTEQGSPSNSTICVKKKARSTGKRQNCASRFRRRRCTIRIRTTTTMSASSACWSSHTFCRVVVWVEGKQQKQTRERQHHPPESTNIGIPNRQWQHGAKIQKRCLALSRALSLAVQPHDMLVSVVGRAQCFVHTRLKAGGG